MQSSFTRSHDVVVKFDTYRYVQRHRAVIPAIAWLSCSKNIFASMIIGYVWQSVSRWSWWTRTVTAVRRWLIRRSRNAYRNVSTGSLIVWPSTIAEVAGIVICTLVAQPKACSGTTAATDIGSSVTHVSNSDNNRHVASHNFLSGEIEEEKVWAPVVTYRNVGE